MAKRKRETLPDFLRRELLQAGVPLDDVDIVVARIGQRFLVDALVASVRMLERAGFKRVPTADDRWLFQYQGYAGPDDDDGLDDLLE